MWPTTLSLAPDVEAHLALLGGVATAFVVVVLLVLLVTRRRRRREILRVTCPENQGRATIVVDPSPDDGSHDAVVRCSRWHDGRLDCGERCVRETDAARHAAYAAERRAK
jgi:hypothetical protein